VIVCESAAEFTELLAVKRALATLAQGNDDVQYLHFFFEFSECLHERAF